LLFLNGWDSRSTLLAANVSIAPAIPGELANYGFHGLFAGLIC
jgi:hypothetical protein